MTKKVYTKNDLVLELAQFTFAQTLKLTNGGLCWNEMDKDWKEHWIVIANREIAFLKSKGFKQVEPAKIPTRLNEYEPITIDDYERLNPKGLFTLKEE